MGPHPCCAIYISLLCMASRSVRTIYVSFLGLMVVGRTSPISTAGRSVACWCIYTAPHVTASLTVGAALGDHIPSTQDYSGPPHRTHASVPVLCIYAVPVYILHTCSSPLITEPRSDFLYTLCACTGACPLAWGMCSMQSA